MNSVLLLALLCAQSEPPAVKTPTPIAYYKLEDFHFYDESLKIHGLPLTTKFYVEADEDFGKYSEKLENLIELKKALKGVIVAFKDKESAFKALNKCLKEGYKAYPIVNHDEVDKVVSPHVLVKIRPSVGRGDYVKHLQQSIHGKFEVSTRNADPRIFDVEFTEINSPSNVLILSNLINQDRFWVEEAWLVLIPLNGWISARVEIDTPSYTNLGQERTLKLTIDIFDPKIEVKLDLLPQVGNIFAPNPYAGEQWLDVKTPQVSQIKSGNKTTITALYRFRYLRFGKFVFGATPIPYEKNGKPSVVYTNACEFIALGVLGNIDDIQPESYTSDLKNVAAVEPKISNDEYTSILLADAKKTIPGWATVIAMVFFLGFIAELISPLFKTAKTNDNMGLWNELRKIHVDNFEDAPSLYWHVERKLNELMISKFNLSLYAVNPGVFNSNFSALYNELAKIHMSSPQYDVEVLKSTLAKFCKERKYD